MIHDIVLINEFIINVQKYYGVYENENVRNDVANYVRKNYYPSELKPLLENLKKHFSVKWKVQPDIAMIIETEKSYPLIHYMNEIRQIPEQDKKQIEYKQEENEELPIDFKSEFEKLIKDNQKKLKKKEG